MGCDTDSDLPSSSSVSPSVVRDAFYHGGFGTLADTLLRSEDVVRSSLVTEIDNLCNDGTDILESLNDAALSEAAVAGQILLRSGLRNEMDLSSMSLEDQRNTLIVANADYYDEGVSYYQSLSTLENSRLGYFWYLTNELANFMEPLQQVPAPTMNPTCECDTPNTGTVGNNGYTCTDGTTGYCASDEACYATSPFVKGEWCMGCDTDCDPSAVPMPAPITSSETSVYNLRAEDTNLGMDCLSVRKIGEEYFGVYHSMRINDLFDLYVARSTDLVSWTDSNILFTDVSMGKFVEAWGGILLVVEHGNPTISVGVAFYSSVEKFASGLAPDNHFISTRTISSAAEGTPNVLTVEGTSVHDSRISIGLHYYKDGSIDQQAVAVLENFVSWTVMASTISNDWMFANGYEGKVGQREIFNWGGQELWTIEAQQVLDDWFSWRVFIGDGLGFIQADLQTPKRSTSQANPIIMQSDENENEYVATIFIPSEGSGEGEAGELLYTFHPIP